MPTACQPVPQPATSKSTASVLPRGRNGGQETCPAKSGRWSSARPGRPRAPSADRDFLHIVVGRAGRLRRRFRSGAQSSRAAHAPGAARAAAASVDRRARAASGLASSVSALASACSGSYIASAASCSGEILAPDAIASPSAALSRSICASSSGVVAKTYSLMKHCFASAQPSVRTLSAAAARRARRRAMRRATRERALDREVAHQDRLQHAKQQGIAGDRSRPRGQAIAPPAAAAARPPSSCAIASPIGGMTATSVAQTPANGLNNCGRSVSARAKRGGGFAQFALRVQQAGEVVAGLRMIGLEQQQPLVDAHRVIELVVLLAGGPLRRTIGWPDRRPHRPGCRRPMGAV